MLQVGSEQPVRYLETAGFRSPLHLGAGGKILLAQFDDGDIELYFRSGFITKSKTTTKNIEAIIREINKIRKEGYSTSSGEVIPSIAAIAVPIRSYIVPACLFVAGPEDSESIPVVPMPFNLKGVHEICALGTIFPDSKGKPQLHMHAALGREGKTRTGCIRLGIEVWKVGEVIILEIMNNHAHREETVEGFEMLKPFI